MDAPAARRALYWALQLSIIPYLFLNMTLPDPRYQYMTENWPEWLQGSAAALILFAFILVCADRPRWGEWALVVGTLACGIVESVFLWHHRERASTPYAGYSLWLVIVHLMLTTVFGLAALGYAVLCLLNKDGDDDGLTGDGDVALPEVDFGAPPRDVIGGHRTILYRWAGYIAALQATIAAVPIIAVAATWLPVRTPAGIAGIVIGICLAFFLVTYGAFTVMRGPWSTASQDSFYVRAKVALLLSVAFTAGFAPLSFPRPQGYGDKVNPGMYFVWALGIAGAVGVLVMLGIILRFERNRGIALADDGEGDDTTLV